jgi:hypothetical protein
MEENIKKPRRFLKMLGKVGEIIAQEALLKILRGVVNRIGGKKNLPSILFLFLSVSLFAQYPSTGNKQRLGYQTTGDGLVWRGRASDTVSLKSSTINNAYIIIDTLTNVMYNYIKTKGGWLFNNADTVIINNNFSQPVDSLFFKTSVSTNNVDTAKMRWDSDLGTVVLGMYDKVPNELGFKNFWLVKNQTGSTITKGSLVYASGTVGSSGRISVLKFIANGTIDPIYLLGITAHDLTDGEDGYVISYGKIRQVNTDTFAAGAILYPSPTTAGVWTDVEPVAPNIDLPIGFCVNSSSNNGTIAIRVASGFSLSELHDVAISSPVANASLYYSGGLWRDTTSALLVSDTASMLTPYFKKSDTTSLNLVSRFAAKLNISDTSSMLTNYLRTGVAASTYLPLTGGTLSGDLVVNDTFKAKDFGSHTFVNYIQNGDFDLTSTIDASAFNYGYPHYIPLHWKSAATAKYVSTWSSTGGYSSPQHFKQYDGDASTGGALYQDVTNWQDLKGKTVTACGWFTKGTLIGSGNHAEIQINDGLTTTTTSIGTTTSWQRACVTKTISASATRVRVIVGCNLAVSGEGGAVSDMDAISLVIGEGKHEFSPKPLFDRDTQRLSGTLLIGYDSENNLAYNPSATSNLKVAGSTNLNGTLGVTGATTLSSTLGVTSTTTLSGALTVNNATVLNEGSGDFDTRIESDANANMVFVDASTDRVGIGTNTPSKTLDVIGDANISGNLTEGGNNVMTNLDTVSLSSRIDGKVSLTGNETIAGNKTFSNQVNMSSTLAVTGAITENGVDVIKGSGTASYIPKFTSTDGIGNSSILDNSGTIIFDSSIVVNDALTVAGATYYSGYQKETGTSLGDFDVIAAGTSIYIFEQTSAGSGTTTKEFLGSAASNTGRVITIANISDNAWDMAFTSIKPYTKTSTTINQVSSGQSITILSDGSKWLVISRNF